MRILGLIIVTLIIGGIVLAAIKVIATSSILKAAAEHPASADAIKAQNDYYEQNPLIQRPGESMATYLNRKLQVTGNI